MPKKPAHPCTGRTGFDEMNDSTIVSRILSQP